MKRTKRRRGGKSRRTRKQRRGGYTYGAKNRSRRSRQSGKRTSRNDRIDSITRELHKIVPKDPRFLKDLFESIDVDGSGGIDWSEFNEYFTTPRS